MYREVSEMPRCAACGILVPAQERRIERAEAQLVVCSPRCERLYDEYVEPRYGGPAPGPRGADA